MRNYGDATNDENHSDPRVVGTRTFPNGGLQAFRNLATDGNSLEPSDPSTWQSGSLFGVLPASQVCPTPEEKKRGVTKPKGELE